MKNKIALFIILLLIVSFQASAADKKIKLLTLEWEPYVGSAMLNKGYTAQIISRAFTKAGYEVSISFHPWNEAMAIAARGEADGVFPAYHEKSREENFIFSDSFASSPLGLCKRKYFQMQSPQGISEKSGINIQFVTDPRIDQTQTLKELQQYTFGVVKGYVNTPEFDAAGFLKKVTVNSDTDNLAGLLRDKVELIVIDRYVARNILVKTFPWHLDKIEFMHPPLSNKKLYLAISKKTGSPGKKLHDFNAGLSILMEDGVLNDLKHQYGF